MTKASQKAQPNKAKRQKHRAQRLRQQRHTASKGYATLRRTKAKARVASVPNPDKKTLPVSEEIRTFV